MIDKVIWVGRKAPSKEFLDLIRIRRVDLGIVEYPNQPELNPELIRTTRCSVSSERGLIAAINCLWRNLGSDFIILDSTTECLFMDLKGLETTLLLNRRAYGIHGFQGSGDTGWTSWVPILGTLFSFRALQLTRGFKEDGGTDLTVAALEFATRCKNLQLLPYRQVVRGRRVSIEEAPPEARSLENKGKRLKKRFSISIFGENQNILALSSLVEIWATLGEEVEIQVWCDRLAYSPHASFGVLPDFGEEELPRRKAQWIEASLGTDADYLVLIDGLIAPIENTILDHIRTQMKNSSVGGLSEGAFSIWDGLWVLKLETFRRMRLATNLTWWADQFPAPERVFISSAYDGIKGSLRACGEEIKILGVKVGESVPGFLQAKNSVDLISLLEQKTARR